jgi:arginine/ornithine N-succinyltransferase beta subunit
MISHQGEHYRISMGEIVCHDDDTIYISAKLAESLQCSVGDKVRYHFI